MTKARDIASAAPAPSTVSATELGYLDGVTSNIQTQINNIPTGYQWTSRIQPTSLRFNTIAYNGSNLYVAAGNSGQLYTSPNGITWTSRTSGFGSNDIYKVLYANSLWVAVGIGGTITTSTDGITWTARTSGFAAGLNIHDVHYANSLFVAVGEGGGLTNTGGVTYSSDGITWTRSTGTSALNVATYTGVIYNGSYWIVSANSNSGSNYMYSTTPSGTWSQGSIGGFSGSVSCAGVWWDGTRTIFARTSGTYLYSTNALVSTQSLYNGTNVVNTTNQAVPKSMVYNGRFYGANPYLLSFSTTPSSNSSDASSNVSPLVLLPTATVQTTTPFITAQTPTIWAGAAGLIVANDAGQIWTSF